jgi:hypothetical protein
VRLWYSPSVNMALAAFPFSLQASWQMPRS